MSPRAADFSLMHFVQPLERRPDFATRSMFGCLAVYLKEINVLVLAERADRAEWNGILVPTARPHHESLRAEHPALSPHPELGKWLYLPQSHPDFEPVAEAVVALIRRGDPRIGVARQPKTRKPAKKRPAARKEAPQRSRKKIPANKYP